jgi:hypothetical protein
LALPLTGAPLPDGVDPLTGAVSCQVARILDQALMFLALNADVLRSLVGKTSWSAAAADRLRAMDKTFLPPAPALVQVRREGAVPAATEQDPARTDLPATANRAADLGVR